MFWVWILSIWEKSYFMLVIFLYIKSTSYFKFFNILIILNNNFLINFHCEFSKIRSALYQNKVTHKLLTLHLRELLWIIFFFLRNYFWEIFEVSWRKICIILLKPKIFYYYCEIKRSSCISCSLFRFIHYILYCIIFLYWLLANIRFLGGFFCCNRVLQCVFLFL